MPETDTWVKDQLISQAQTQTLILGKLDRGAERMDELHASLNTVIDATSEFAPMKIDVDQLKKSEELRVKEEQLKVQAELTAIKAKQALWGERMWSLFLKASPVVVLVLYFLYNQIKDQL